MDISFYVLLILACLVLLLAMWACASSNTPKWGPDLTLELPPHVLQDALFRTPKKQPVNMPYSKEAVPSAPSELPCDPLLTNEQPVGMSSPPTRHYHPVFMNTNNAVRVLPTHYIPQQKVRPVFCTFSIEKPA